jgi:hypothetical protein
MTPAHKPGLILLIGLMILAVLIGGALTAAAPQPVHAQILTATLTPADTASTYLSDMYQTEGTLPLHTWQPITVYGETFPACVIDLVGQRSTLTVNPEASRVCGDL